MEIKFLNSELKTTNENKGTIFDLKEIEIKYSVIKHTHGSDTSGFSYKYYVFINHNDKNIKYEWHGANDDKISFISFVIYVNAVKKEIFNVQDLNDYDLGELQKEYSK